MRSSSTGTKTEALRQLPQPGQVLAGKYRVERLLGAGGMGAVLAATHVELGQGVAIKLMLPAFKDSPESVARFLREAHAAANIRSEHVARVFDVGRLPDGAPFMVMELLEGRDLDHVFRERGPLPIDEVVGWILEACDALAEAHAMGIVHRDLKPANLFLAERRGAPPILKVLDFGISKQNPLDGAPDGGGLTGTDASLGSPQYMSPEQIQSARSVDARTDIWALGITLHRLLTSHFAFKADSMGAYLAKVLGGEPVPLRAERFDAPPGLEAVLLRCLEKDPARRFPSIAELARALAPFGPEGSRPLVGQPSAAPTRARVGSERVRVPVAVALEMGTVTSAAAALAPTARVSPRSPWAIGAAVAITATAVVAMATGGFVAYRLLGPVARGSAAPPPPTATAIATAPSATAPVPTVMPVASASTAPTASAAAPPALRRPPPAVPPKGKGPMATTL